MVDETTPEQRAPMLLQLERELSSLYAGETLDDPVLLRFGRALYEAKIPVLYPSELLQGMGMDVHEQAYSNWQELELYCYRVASTVGLMMCHVLGVQSTAALPHAAQLGLAMQLTNICRDVHEDWRRGRLYLPDSLLAECGAGGLRAELGGPLPPSAALPLRRAVGEVLALAARHYRAAESGFPYLPRRCAFAVATARFIYADIGRELQRVDHDVFAPRALVSTPRKLALLARAVACVLAQRRTRADLVNHDRPLSEVPYAASLFAL